MKVLRNRNHAGDESMARDYQGRNYLSILIFILFKFMSTGDGGLSGLVRQSEARAQSWFHGRGGCAA